jgi:hypothetical protein
MNLLIEELTPSQANIIVEASGSEGSQRKLYLNGIFMQADVVNQNKRVYPLDEMTREVQRAQRIISESNGIFGELDHPTTLTVNLDRISHFITELKMVGSDVYGKAQIITDTPMGKIAAALINTNVRLGVSSRGTGHVNESSGNVSNFGFVTVDIVANPSAVKALPVGIYESLQLTQNGRQTLSLAESVIHDQNAQKYFVAAFQKFLADMQFQKR